MLQSKNINSFSFKFIPFISTNEISEERDIKREMGSYLTGNNIGIQVYYIENQFLME